MCGIAGWLDFETNITGNDAVLEAMSKTLERRGPDSHGEYKVAEGCLLHRRLAVIDPQNGLQPMTRMKGDTSYTITYNGELYNTEELRHDLAARGYEFITRSDTEVLLTSYIEWGEACLERLNGIYAFAVWNAEKKELFAARDRIGVKPFFYYVYKNGFIFGSELKTLLANPMVEPLLDEDGIRELFLLGPGRKPGSGVIYGVKELKPGKYLKLDREHLTVKPYWSLTAEEHPDSETETIAHTRELLSDAISRQLVSDVPLCCLLSGGLDSSIISAVAAENCRKRGKKLTTYSVDYQDNDKYFKANAFQPTEDAPFIEQMSNYIGSDHRRILLSNLDLADALDDAVFARDLPGMADIDSSLLLFSREIKKDYTVGVSGECADEIFGGYPWYHREDILFREAFPWSRSARLRESLLKPGTLGCNAVEYIQSQYRDTVSRVSRLPGESRKNARMREMFCLNFSWFMQTLLDRKDRMSMYCGLEMRVPFCDHRLVEYAYNMPWEFKALYGREKGILRKAFEGILPYEIIWRKKSPYPKTMNPVYEKKVTEKVFTILEDGSPIGELVDFKRLRELAEHPEQVKEPWYGQLMRTPQMFAYLYQLHVWMKQYKIRLK